MKKQFEGAFPVLITPMNEDYSVNYEGLKENIQYYLDQKVPGIVVVGSTGEFASLDEAEKKEIVKIAGEVVKDTETDLLVGIADERTDKVLEYAKHAEANHADGLLLINSYYMTPTEEEAFEQFKEVNDQVSTPIMMYNNPFTANVNLENETIYKIDKELDNVQYIKESSGDIRKVRAVADNTDLVLFCGADDLALESFVLGATGWISVAANIVPNSAGRLYELVKAKNYDGAKELYKDLLPLCEFLEDSGKYVQIVKKAMELKGLNGGPSRKPRLGLTEEEITKLKELMEKLD
ncbi:dihydrodipicolinate synthase family protein [Oceanobacillus oncorhynchi subsp. incaldanensis]|uniref:4-hydroxy-tetrahydrodipicolinate synthase n=3 Tax=Oceanobacillus TaxID=182709 RepID=A0A0A1MFH5_9BACI|nr:dihydrodipicolinate synthase family protein [Oceanobacillus oncorhynchi]MDM8099832.1 dihydrodipicolinate synthase family protein [Oceanobacillus oncorhynchi]GIO20663.1 dihydrodipicolinate synthase family protein [Oceanobacillus oncorhynchi subsp. incaldanensis]CEI81803.1 4-hydroxy-tetrahydrodipicolinate synthase [Oceanobacillus oncorhynchi]